MRAIKQAEDGSAFILRLQELWGRPTEEITLRLNIDIVDAWETDGQERWIGPAELKDGRLVFGLGKYGIKSFAVVPKNVPINAKDLVCVSVELPFDTRAFTSDQARGMGELPMGRSYPAELVPEEIRCGGVVLRTGTGRERNAVACRGQTIPLPAGNWDQLFLLAAAAEDTDATFCLGHAHADGVDANEMPFSLHIQAAEGLVGVWDRRIWNKPMEKQPNHRWWASVTGLERGFIKRDRIGWYTTHMHNPDGNDAYAYGYMFLYAVPLPVRTSIQAAGRALRLPDREDILIFAATATEAEPIAKPAAPMYDELARLK